MGPQARAGCERIQSYAGTGCQEDRRFGVSRTVVLEASAEQRSAPDRGSRCSLRPVTASVRRSAAKMIPSRPHSPGRLKQVWTALLLVAFVGCAGQVGGRDTHEGDGERFISEGWILGETRADVRRRLGEPLAIRVHQIKNQHDPEQIDERHEFWYEGLTLAFYVAKAGPEREFLTDISVTDRRYELGRDLKVGTPKEHVIRLLGGKFVPLRQPDLRSWMPAADRECGSDVCTYEYTDQYSHVYFSFKDGRVSRVDWVFWVD